MDKEARIISKTPQKKKKNDENSNLRTISSNSDLRNKKTQKGTEKEIFLGKLKKSLFFSSLAPTFLKNKKKNVGLFLTLYLLKISYNYVFNYRTFAAAALIRYYYYLPF